MVKYFCDCCGKEMFSLEIVNVRTIVPFPSVTECLCFEDKGLCAECKATYHELCGVAIVKVWEDMCRDKSILQQIQ